MGSKSLVPNLSRIGVTALIVCVSVLAESELAFAASASDPISINDCHINNSRAFVSAYKPLAITFTNRRAVAADEVRFTFEYASKTAHVDDTGTWPWDSSGTQYYLGR